jgi:hypothetical protein
MTPRTLNNQDGIALGPILFIIAILAVLAGAIAAGSGSFTANTSAESAKVMAGAILNYADQVQAGVDMVRSHCDDTQISFQSPSQVFPSQYANPNSPADGSCNVFSPAGGGVVWQDSPPQSALDLTLPQQGSFPASNSYSINSGNFVAGVGSSGAGSSSSNPCPIVLYSPYITKAVCQQINLAVSGSTTIPVNQWGFGVNPGFTGIFAPANAGDGGIKLTPSGQTKYCFSDPSHAGYWFYQAVVVK